MQRLKEACRDAERKCNAWEKVYFPSNLNLSVYNNSTYIKAYGTLREQLRPVNNQNRIVDDPSQALDYTNESHSRTIRRRTEITSIRYVNIIIFIIEQIILISCNYIL